MKRPHNEKRRPARGGVGSFVGRAGTPKPYRAPAVKATPGVEAVREIHIDREIFGCGFDVNVLPDGIMGRELPTYAEARAFADQLHAEYGWRVVDNCAERLAVLP